MKYLNLSNGFNPFGVEGIDVIQFKSFTFNGGEPHIQLHDEELDGEDISISVRLNSFNDVGLLCVAVNALHENCWVESVSVIIPYFPGARQDRICNEGEPLTVKVYAQIINSLNFKDVIIYHPHSDVASALINNVIDLNNHSFVASVLDREAYDKDEYLLISPDAGSNKDMYDLCAELDISTYIRCDKHRDVSTGQLKDFIVYADDLQGKACFIIDDICDGGGTFIGLAEELKKKNAGDLYLVVSHGIFSKGFAGLGSYFKNIYTTDSFKSWDKTEVESCHPYTSVRPQLTEIKLEDLLWKS